MTVMFQAMNADRVRVIVAVGLDQKFPRFMSTPFGLFRTVVLDFPALRTGNVILICIRGEHSL